MLINIMDRRTRVPVLTLQWQKNKMAEWRRILVTAKIVAHIKRNAIQKADNQDEQANYPLKSLWLHPDDWLYLSKLTILMTLMWNLLTGRGKKKISRNLFFGSYIKSLHYWVYSVNYDDKKRKYCELHHNNYIWTLFVTRMHLSNRKRNKILKSKEQKGSIFEQY